MNKPIRRVGILMMVMLVLLLANDSYVQVVEGSTWANNPAIASPCVARNRAILA